MITFLNKVPGSLKELTNMRTASKLLVLSAVVIAAGLCIGFGKKERTIKDLQHIAGMGGGLVIDASGRTPNELVTLAALSKGSGATLYLKACGGLETADLVKIAALGKGHVVFEF